MKLVGLCSIAVVLGSMTSLAQSTGRNVSQPAIVSAVVPASTNCPVDIQAQKDSGVGQLQHVPANGNQNLGPSLILHLTLTNTSYSEIQGVKVTASGLNAKGELTPAKTAATSSSAIEKTVDLKLKVSPQSTGSVDLELTGFTSVTLLNVDSIQYAGRSAWQASATNTCHIVPDGTMLISSR